MINTGKTDLLTNNSVTITIPYLQNNSGTNGKTVANISQKIEFAKIRMTSILGGLLQFLVVMYP